MPSSVLCDLEAHAEINGKVPLPIYTSASHLLGYPLPQSFRHMPIRTLYLPWLAMGPKFPPLQTSFFSIMVFNMRKQDPWSLTKVLRAVHELWLVVPKA